MTLGGESGTVFIFKHSCFYIFNILIAKLQKKVIYFIPATGHTTFF